MAWIILGAVVLTVKAAAFVIRRIVARSYADIYGGDEPPYQDPPPLNFPTSGGIG
jgi:hypothetical protein